MTPLLPHPLPDAPGTAGSHPAAAGLSDAGQTRAQTAQTGTAGQMCQPACRPNCHPIWQPAPAGRPLLAGCLAGLCLLCAWPAEAEAIPFPPSSHTAPRRIVQSSFQPGSVPGRVAVVRRMSADAAAKCLGLAKDFYRWNELKPSARLLPGCELWLDDPCLLAQVSPGLAAGTGTLPVCGALARTAEARESHSAGRGKARGESRPRQARQDSQARLGASPAPATLARPEKPGRPDSLKKPDSQDRPGGQARLGASPAPAAPDRPEKPGRPDSLKKPGGRDMPDSPDSLKKPDSQEKPDSQNRPSGQPAKAGKAGKGRAGTLTASPASGGVRAGTALARASFPGTPPGSAGTVLELRPGSCSAQLAAYLGDLGWQLAWRLSRDIWISAHADYPGTPAEALKRLFKDLDRAGQPCRVTVYTANRVIEVRED